MATRSLWSRTSKIYRIQLHWLSQDMAISSRLAFRRKSQELQKISAKKMAIHLSKISFRSSSYAVNLAKNAPLKLSQKISQLKVGEAVKRVVRQTNIPLNYWIKLQVPLLSGRTSIKLSRIHSLKIIKKTNFRQNYLWKANLPIRNLNL